ncbi:MAG: choice-of-anchor L domain-containing protein [Xenococcaceae cyanobacterium MO_207.B15]|nr:choice-of-anchor L domain-containing protein [Xenococcaceae cyanobacterium MO_207.B15]
MDKISFQPLISAIPLCLSFALINTQSAKALTITPTSDGNTLFNTITGSGITIDPSSINFIGADGSSGTFTDGLSSGIGIESGIILTTGQASSAVGPNVLDNTATINGTSGDSDLDALIPQSTFDAVVLEFDFESAGGDIFFDYVFASEEYNEFANSGFNDVFAFFLDGQNIALIPGTNIPVSINNVNGGNPLGTNASNSQFYNNNDLSDGGPFFNIEYDGFTDVFTAQFLGLAPGSHTLKLAIADGGDSDLDSAVFIASGSLTDVDDDVKVPEPASIFGLLTMGTLSATALKRKKNN